MKAMINKYRRLLILLIGMLYWTNAGAVALWVGQSYTWDFSGSVLGSTYNLSVTSTGGNLSITGSGFYRNITPTQYFSGNAVVTAEWDYNLGSSRYHQRITLTVTCNENKVSISPTSVMLTPGQTYQLGYRHAYDNSYVGAANVYFSGGNSSFSVSSSGLITAKSAGTGYVTVYSKLSSAANAPSCYVTVKEVEPTGASISNVNILADQSQVLSVAVSPSNATVKTKQWYIKDGSDVISISGSNLTGLKPGKATFYCIVNGSVRSNDATATVIEPELIKSSSFPDNEASDVSVFVNPSVSYSNDVFKGSDLDDIQLVGNGKSIEGDIDVTGRTVRFLPTRPLSPHTKYELKIPRTAVKNKWGSTAKTDVTLTFTTGSLEKASVSISPSAGSFLTRNDMVTLSSYPSDAKIYYTINGSEPSKSSSVYTAPLQYDMDFTIKAFASREGYEDSEVIIADYFKSQSEIIAYYPADAKPLFNYAYAVPHLKLSGPVIKSNNFRRISLKDNYGNEIKGRPLITNYIISFIPDETLHNGMSYTMNIPYDAVKTLNGEIFNGFNWTFSTPDINTSVSMRGDETVYVLAENGKLRARGLQYGKTNLDNGSFTSEDTKALTEVMSGVNEIKTGYTHEMVSRDTGVFGQGLTFCSEVGTESGRKAVGAIKTIRAGFQTSAIITEDNSLWMCGRNDFYQLGDGSGSTLRDFVKITENVKDVALGNGFSLWVDCDDVLWAVGRNHLGQLGDGTTLDRKVPVKILDGVDKVFASASGFFSACVTTDGRMLSWGDNCSGQLGYDVKNYSPNPVKVLDNVVRVALGESHSLALTSDFRLYAWGANSFCQISPTGLNILKPTLLAENVKDFDAGANTSLILFYSGRVAAYGRKTHSNFGDGNGMAVDDDIDAALPYAFLSGVSIEPYRFEAKPDEEFALIVSPKPYASDYDTIEWYSDRPETANVYGNGLIRTNQHGQATITARMIDRFGNVKEASAIVRCTDNPDNSGVESIAGSAGDWTVKTSDMDIEIENVSPNSIFYVYNSLGICIFSGKAVSSTLSVSVDSPGVYFVTDGQKSVKVVCR